MTIRTAVSMLLLTLALCTGAQADTVALTPDHPDRYVVVKGDTLWDISARFLRDPWKWPDVWKINPQIDNPHLIYPGDTVVLTFQEGQPVLQLERAAGSAAAAPAAFRSSAPAPPIATSTRKKTTCWVMRPCTWRMRASTPTAILPSMACCARRASPWSAIG